MKPPDGPSAVDLPSHLPNLDGIRLIAALAVVMFHSVMFKLRVTGEQRNWLDRRFEHCGSEGVNLFFVLSGLLITYLLLKERSKHGRIDVKAFYLRRVLRIWPLYFLVGLGGTLASHYMGQRLGLGDSGGNLTTNLLYMAGFLINFQLVFGNYSREIVEILWSVCVEEQFYLLWPLLLIAWGRCPLLAMATMILSAFAYKAWVFATVTDPHRYLNLVYFIPLARFDSLGLGALGGWALFAKRDALLDSPLFSVGGVRALGLAAAAWMLNFVHFDAAYWQHTFSATLFALLLVGLILRPQAIPLEHPVFRWGGGISYGIYVYHTFWAQILLLPSLNPWSRSPVFLTAGYPLALCAATLLTAWMSHRWFEKPFLALKDSFGKPRAAVEPSDAQAGPSPNLIF